MVAVPGGILPTVALDVAAHPSASVTVTSYVPGVRLEAVLLVWLVGVHK